MEANEGSQMEDAEDGRGLEGQRGYLEEEKTWWTRKNTEARKG